MTSHHVRRSSRRGRRGTGAVAVAVAVGATVVVGGVAGAITAPVPSASTVVVLDDTGAIAVGLPEGWSDIQTAPTDFDGDGVTQPWLMASPDNDALVNTFDVPGVLVTIPNNPGTHDELMGAYGLPEGCASLITEPFADATLTGIIQRGDGCGSNGAVWRTIVGDTADGRTVVAQGQAPSALELTDLNAALASVVVLAADDAVAPSHAPAGTSTPMVTVTDASGSVTIRVPAAWADVEANPFDFGSGAAQPYVLASTDRQSFLETFDAPGLGVTIPNWEATHEELLADFGLTSGCAATETVSYADGNLTGLLQRGSQCGGGTAEWRAVVGDTVDGLTIVVVSQTPTTAGLSELEEAIGSIAITAEFGGEEEVVTGDTKAGTPTTVAAVPTTVAAVPTTVALPPTTAAAGGVTGDTVFDPPPDGFVRIIDDTGTLTVLAPDSWTWVDTYELDVDGGKARIIATPDLGVFQGDGDVGGALLIAEPYTDDAQSLVADFRRDESCATNEELPYDDGTYAGWMWIGESCGPAGAATWSVIVASPADASVTLRLHLRAAAGEDVAAQIVLSSFSALPAGTVPAATLPERIVPPGALPADIADAFLTALRFGDGDGACSLLDPNNTGNVGLSIQGCGARITTWYPAALAQDVAVVGEPATSDGECSASDSSDPTATGASVEFTVGAESGCVSLEREPGGEWVIVDFTGSLLSAGG